MPDLFDGVTARDAMKVQRIVGQALEDGEPYKQSVQAKMWVGVAVAEVLDLDVEKKHEKAKIRASKTMAGDRRLTCRSVLREETGKRGPGYICWNLDNRRRGGYE